MVFVWIALYGIAYMAAQAVAQALNIHWLPAAAMAGYIGLLCRWTIRTGKHTEVGLCRPRWKSPAERTMLIPLFLLPACHFWEGYGFSRELSFVLLMAGVCAAEELFFRGFLLRFLLKAGAVPAVLLSSGAFALFHCANLLNGGDLAYTITQTVCAFVVGVCYGAVSVLCGSLLPGFLAHFLTNITAAPAHLQVGWGTAWLWVCIAVYGVFSAYFCRKMSAYVHKEKEL